MAGPPERLGSRLIAEARLAKWETQIANAVKRALRVHQARALADVRSALRAAAVPPDPFDAGTWIDTLGRELEPVLNQVFAEIGEGTMAAWFADPSAYPPVDMTHHLDRMLGHMAGLGPDMSERLGRTLGEGFNAGEGLYDLERRVRETFGVGERRGERIARTETVGAANGASHEVAETLIAGGIALDKEWLATGDDRTRPTHRAASGQRKPFDQPFLVGSCELQRPHDPLSMCAREIVNCRCVLLYPEPEPEEVARATREAPDPMEQARRRAYKAVTPYRAEARREAARVADSAMAHLDAADVATLATPPRRRLVIDPVSGARRWTRGEGGEWDWFDQLAPEEQARLRPWMRKGPGGDQYSPDLIAQRWSDLYGGDPTDVDGIMGEWLVQSRRHDAAKALARGRLPSESGYGGLDVNDVLPETSDRFDVGALFGDPEEAVEYLTRLRAEEALEALDREFTDAVLGRAPWEMSEEEWVAELFDVQDRVLRGRVTGTDEWGDTYTPDAEAALARLAELVPRGMDPWGADIDSAFEMIVELAIRAGKVEGG